MDKPWEVLKNYELRGYRFEVRDGQLILKGDHGSLTEAQRQLLTDHKAALIECIEARKMLAETLTHQIDRACNDSQLELALERTTEAHAQQQLTGAQVEALARRMVARSRRFHREPGVIYQPSVTA